MSGDFSMEVNLFDLATSIHGGKVFKLEEAVVKLGEKFGPRVATEWLGDRLVPFLDSAAKSNPALARVMEWLGGPVELASSVAQLLADRWLHLGCYGSCTTLSFDAGRLNLLIVLKPDGSAEVSRHWIDLGLPVMGPSRLVSFDTTR